MTAGVCLSDEIPEEGVEVTLKAELELQGETTEYIRKVQVYPPEIKDGMRFLGH